MKKETYWYLGLELDNFVNNKIYLTIKHRLYPLLNHDRFASCDVLNLLARKTDNDLPWPDFLRGKLMAESHSFLGLHIAEFNESRLLQPWTLDGVNAVSQLDIQWVLEPIRPSHAFLNLDKIESLTGIEIRMALTLCKSRAW